MANQTAKKLLDPAHLEFRRELCRHWLKITVAVNDILGDGRIGFVLLDRFWSGDDPWVSADYVTASLQGIYSDDTVRRRLKQLVKQDQVLQRLEGRLKLYAIRPSLAEEITTMMEGFAMRRPLTANCGQNPMLIRNLREGMVVIGPFREDTPRSEQNGTDKQ